MVAARALVRFESSEAVILVVPSALSRCGDEVVAVRALVRSESDEAMMLVISSALFCGM